MTNDSDRRLDKIEQSLTNQSIILSDIRVMLGELKVQDEKISGHESQLKRLWNKENELTNPKDGVLTRLSREISKLSSLDKQIKAIWVILLMMLSAGLYYKVF